ncbi:MAG: tyrosine-type recombinase/integrase [Spirochaetota bacterium]|nr:tyrosine-type recombinase/integrase [Spirochaetota bacterium]
MKSKRAEGRNLSPVYCENNRKAIQKYFLLYMEYRRIKTLADLNKKVLLEWRNHLFEHGRIKLPDDTEEGSRLTAVTINKVRQAVHVALEHAEAIDLIPVNPMRSIKRVHETPQKVGFFEIDEVRKLFAHPWGDFRAYTASILSVSTGLRLGELQGLLWGNVDIEKQYLNVVTNWQDGQGIKPPKWGDVRYGVPFPSKIVEALETLKEMNPHPISPEAFVFFGETAESPIPRQILLRELKQAMKREGIPERQPTHPDARRTFHSLRHTAGTLLAAKLPVWIPCNVFLDTPRRP